jgi:hypothetical protein
MFPRFGKIFLWQFRQIHRILSSSPHGSWLLSVMGSRDRAAAFLERKGARRASAATFQTI